MLSVCLSFTKCLGQLATLRLYYRKIKLKDKIFLKAENNYNYYINYYNKLLYKLLHNYLILKWNSKLELYVYKISGVADIPTEGHSHSHCPQKNVHSFSLE